MYPALENSNMEAARRIKSIAIQDPPFLVACTARLAEVTKYYIYPLSEQTIRLLIEDFREVTLPPLPLIALDEIGYELAAHVSDATLADDLREFSAMEGYLLLVSLELYFAHERANPGLPVTLEAFSPFFPVVGIDQI
jgi:hypothetical protein